MKNYVYEGPDAEATVVRNRTKGGIDIEIPVLDEAGKPTGSPGKREMRLLRLGSSLDDDVPEDVPTNRPEQKVAKKDWAYVLANQPAVRGLVKGKKLEHFAAAG